MIAHRRSLRFLVLLLFLTLAPFTLYANDLSGSITTDTTVGPGETTVTGNVTVEPSVTLTIEPGAMLTFAGSFSLTVKGNMEAEGTASSPITFTSGADDPSAGDWGQIRFHEDAFPASVLNHVVVQYASTGLYAASSSSMTLQVSNITIKDVSETGINVSNAPLELNSTGGSATIRDFEDYGMYVTGTSASVTADNVTIEQTGSRIRSGSGVRIRNGALLNLTGSTLRSNGVGIDVYQQRFGNDEYPQRVIASGNQITANAIGVRVRPNNRDSRGRQYPDQFEVTGNVIAGNVDYDAAIYDGRNAGSTELNLTGNWWGTRDGVAIAERIRDQSDDGGSAFAKFIPYLDSEGGSPTTTDADGREMRAGYVFDDETWSPATPVVLVGKTIMNGRLTLAAGTEVRSRGNGLIAYGEVVSNATAGSPVTFVSDQSTPRAGDWAGVTLKAGAAADLAHWQIRHARTGLVLQNWSSTRQISALDVMDVSNRGVLLQGSSVDAQDWSISQSSGEGVKAEDNSDLTMTGATLQDIGSTALNISGATATISGMQIRDFEDYGMYVTGTSASVTADNVTIEQTGSRIRSGSGVRIRNGALLNLTGSTLRSNGVGIDVYQQRFGNDEYPQRVIASGNQITANAIGVRVRPNNRDSRGRQYPDQFEVTGNVIAGNVDYDAAIYDGRNAGSTELNLTGNWWGTRDGVAIAERIRDQSDDGGSAFAKFIPYLDSEGGSPTTTDADGREMRAGYVFDDETWSPATPVVLVGKTIMNGRLTLAAGTEVRSRGNGLIAYGEVVSNATAGSPVTFVSDQSTPRAGDWAGVTLKAGAAADLAHWQIRHARTGLVLQNWSSTRQISALDVMDVSNRGVLLQGSSVDAQDWSISQSSGEGVKAEDNSDLTMTGATLQDIGSTALNISGATATISGMQIRDFEDYGMYVTGTSASVTADNVTIEQTGSRIRSGSGVRIRNGALLNLTGSTLRSNGVGIDVYQQRFGNDEYPQRVIASGNQITANAIGVRVRPNNRDSRGRQYPDQFEVTGNVIAGNVDYDAAIYDGRNAGSTELNLTGNWWGTRDGVAIAERIRDQSDDGGSAFAKFIPYLDSEGGSPTTTDADGREIHAGIVADSPVWNASSDHVVVGNISVLGTGVLTIQPGTDISFVKGTIDANGSLLISGTDDQRIQFLPEQEGGSWGGILLRDGSQSSQISYATIKGVGTGIRVLDVPQDRFDRFPVFEGLDIRASDTGIRVENSRVDIANSKIIGFANNGLRVDGDQSEVYLTDQSTIAQQGINARTGTCVAVGNRSNVYVRQSTIASCNRGINAYSDGSQSNPTTADITGTVLVNNNIGIRIDPRDDNDPYPSVSASGNDILGNLDWNVRVEQGRDPGSTTFDFTGNWWSASDSTTIAQGVFDRGDNESVARIDFDPFASSENGTYGLADINRDGKTDGFDLSILATAFGLRDGDEGYNPDANLYDEDTRIDGFDLAILGTRFGELGATLLQRIAEPEPGRVIALAPVHPSTLAPSFSSEPDSVLARDPSTIRVEGPVGPFAPGDTLSYAVQVEGTPSLFAANSAFRYDSERIRFVAGHDGGFVSAGGTDSIVSLLTASDGAGTLGLTRMKSGRDSSPAGSGTLATLQFVATRDLQAAPALALSNVGLIAPNGITQYDTEVDGASSPSDPVVPASTRLEGVSPNPVSTSSQITFTTEASQRVTIALYDLMGRRVQTLTDRSYEAGQHEVLLEGHRLSSGVYLCRMRAEDRIQTVKVHIVR